MKRVMAPGESHKLGAAAVAFCMLMLFAGQATPFAVSKGVVLERDRIPLPGDSPRNAVWETRDLKVDYRFSRSGNRLNISGVVRLDDSIRYNASRLADFHMGLAVADGQGRVRRMRGLATTGFGGVDDPMFFDASFSIPADTAFMTFYYQGEAVDSGGPSGSTFSFWEYPIH